MNGAGFVIFFWGVWTAETTRGFSSLAWKGPPKAASCLVWGCVRTTRSRWSPLRSGGTSRWHHECLLIGHQGCDRLLRFWSSDHGAWMGGVWLGQQHLSEKSGRPYLRSIWWSPFFGRTWRTEVFHWCGTLLEPSDHVNLDLGASMDPCLKTLGANNIIKTTTSKPWKKSLEEQQQQQPRLDEVDPGTQRSGCWPGATF